MTDVLLVLNTGSSSLKFEVFGYEALDKFAKGKVTGIGTEARLSATVVASDVHVDRTLAANDHETAMGAVIDLIDRHDDAWRMVATVHRIVHGGADFIAPVVVTPGILDRLAALAPLAPLHQPYNLAGIAASDRLSDARTSPVSIPPSTPATHRSSRPSPSMRRCGIRASAATVSTACPTSGLPACSQANIPISRAAGSWSGISATAQACVP